MRFSLRISRICASFRRSLINPGSVPLDLKILVRCKVLSWLKFTRNVSYHQSKTPLEPVQILLPNALNFLYQRTEKISRHSRYLSIFRGTEEDPRLQNRLPRVRVIFRILRFHHNPHNSLPAFRLAKRVSGTLDFFWPVLHVFWQGIACKTQSTFEIVFAVSASTLFDYLCDITRQSRPTYSHWAMFDEQHLDLALFVSGQSKAYKPGLTSPICTTSGSGHRLPVQDTT